MGWGLQGGKQHVVTRESCDTMSRYNHIIHTREEQRRKEKKEDDYEQVVNDIGQ